MVFEGPWYWVALPPLLVWVWWLSRRSYAQLSPATRRISTALRLVILACLIGALSRPIWMSSTRGQHVVFLVDASRSLSKENLDAALEDVVKSATEVGKSGPHRFSVIAFGKRPRLVVSGQRGWREWTQEQRDFVLHETSLPELRSRLAKATADNVPEVERKELQRRIDAIDRFRNETVGEATDVAAAIRLAMNTGEADDARVLYLYTDANFNCGEWEGAFESVKAAGHAIQTVAMNRELPPEVAAADLVIPNTVRINQGFTADLRIASTVETDAVLAVYRDGLVSAEIKQTLKRGMNTVQVPGLFFREKGFHTIDVAVRAEKDTRVENNKVRALAVVPGELRVLYVEAEEAQSSYLMSALALEGIKVEARPASGVPRTLDDLLGFDAFILSNVAADRLSARQMQMIRTYVQDFGGGFIMLGGDQSFGLGGYYNTPVEEVLPVRMPIQKELNRPSLAIYLVIDKSGSMEGTKIQLAKRAAIATAEAINPRDQIGLIGFDSDAHELVPLTSAGDRAAVSGGVSELDAGGGTFLYPALEIAHDRLQQSNARRKHVIILSDGQTQGFGYPDIAQMMAGDGITMSTVGIGEGADMKLMEQIAAAGGGRAYFTNDFQTIPQIFTREALRASNSMLVERLVLPTVAADDEAVAEIDGDLPPLAGYVATTARDAAKTIIVSDAGDPILAKWRTGLGRAAAFTSDTKPHWAEDWIKWPDFAKFWAQVVRSVAGQEVAQELSVETTRRAEGDDVRVTAEVRDAAGNMVTDVGMELGVLEAGAGLKPVVVEREGPAQFSARVPRGEYGVTRQLAWKVTGKGAEPTTAPYGFVESFSPEFRTLGPDEGVLSAIRARGLGEARSVGEAVPPVAQRSSRSRVPLWPVLLIAALVLAPVDILCRRMS